MPSSAARLLAAVGNIGMYLAAESGDPWRHFFAVPRFVVVVWDENQPKPVEVVETPIEWDDQ